jgi:shikimate kinase
MHLYLTGFRGSGKSTIAHRLAATLGRSACDLDRAIERSAGRSVRELFEREGESRFRDLESAVLLAAAESIVPQVIALGGGAILRPSNRALIARTGRCVWLRVSLDALVDRLTADQTTAAYRPPLTQLTLPQEVEQLLAQREPLYREVADLIVDGDQSPDEVVRQIQAWWTSGPSQANQTPEC